MVEFSMIRHLSSIREFSVKAVIALALLMCVKTPLLAQEWDPKDYRYYHDPDIATTKKADDGRGSTFSRDPFIWVYTTDFAKRHGMPLEWVDDSLDGVAAIAFRHISANAVECGYFRDKNACSLPVWCQMDFYIPKSANLPWMDDRKQGFLPVKPSRSMHYLKQQIEKDQLKHRLDHYHYLPLVPGIQSMLLSIYKPENVPLGFGRWPELEIGYYGSTDAAVHEIDRSFLPHLDYISTQIGCYRIDKEQAAQGATPVVSVEEFIERPPRDGRLLKAYQFVVPNGYWRRVADFHEKNYDQKGTLFEMVRERMRKGPQ